MHILRELHIRSMPSARFRYIVQGHSPRDGGWVRNVGYFKKVSDALNYIRVIRPLVLLAGDYTTIRVQRIIVFKSGLAAERLERSRTRRRSLQLRDESGCVWRFHRPARDY